MRTAITLLILLAFISPTFSAPIKGPEGPADSAKLAKATTIGDLRILQVNNIFNVYYNDGMGSYNGALGAAGMEYPKGSGNTLVFCDGIVWGGYHRGMLKVGGSTFRSGLQPGPIVTPGTPVSLPVGANPASPAYRLYSVRRDVFPGSNVDLSEEWTLSRRYFPSYDPRTYYQDDWNDWPAGDGAPFEDVNHNGTYEPGVDIPGVPGAAETLWYVVNDGDSTKTNYMYGSPSIGIEMQRTIWAYKTGTALDNSIFMRTRIINKSGFAIDSMLVGQWADPDIGFASDDYHGCDTTLSLAYAYNGLPTDMEYGTRIPAAGFVFLQTPAVPGAPSDTAIVLDGQRRAGWKNVPLYSANALFKCCGETNDPIMGGSYSGTTQMYNNLRGLTNAGNPFIDPTTGLPTRFIHAGDPVNRAGWVDGTDRTAADRRVLMSVGPISLAPGDTQDVVVAAVAEIGGDRISSVTMLRSTAGLVHRASNRSYGIPSITQPPPLHAAGINEQIILSWDDPNITPEIEAFDSLGYRFQGYALFALPDSDWSQRILIGVYDIVDQITTVREFQYDARVNEAFDRTIFPGLNSGIFRAKRIKDDPVTGKWIVNGRTYTFAILWYACPKDPSDLPRHFESPPRAVSVVAQCSKPGSTLPSAFGTVLDTLRVRPSIPTSASLRVSIVDPTQITGHDYALRLTHGPDSLTWDLIDSTSGATRLSRMRYGTSDVVLDPYYFFDPNARSSLPLDVTAPSADGLQFRINYVPPKGFARADWISQGTIVSDENGYPGLGFPAELTLLTIPRELMLDSLCDRIRSDHVLELRFVNSSVGSQYYTKGPYLHTGDIPASDRLPFQIWDVTDGRRLIPVISDLDGDGRFSTRKDSYGLTWSYGSYVRYWETLGVLDPDSAGYYTEPLPAPSAISCSSRALRRISLGSRVDTSQNGPFPSLTGTIVRFVPYHIPQANDAWFINSSGLEPTSGDLAKARRDVDNITVYPNPYMAFNWDEPNKYTRFVTFSHLPQRATIRIFTLSGFIVKTIVKNNADQYVRWDLTNEAHFWVQAGMYIVHIDMPDLGRSKILKLMIIMAGFVPDHL